MNGMCGIETFNLGPVDQPECYQIKLYHSVLGSMYNQYELNQTLALCITDLAKGCLYQTAEENKGVIKRYENDINHIANVAKHLISLGADKEIPMRILNANLPNPNNRYQGSITSGIADKVISKINI